MADQAFFLRYAIVITLFILFGFAQFAMRGYSDFRAAPLTVHLHGGLMIAWLGIFLAQNVLVHRGQLAIHRTLGWTSAAILPFVALTGALVGYNAVALDRVPPFFSDSYFLALSSVGSLAFAAVVAWAIVRRRQVQWHRRLMLGAMFLLLEPALGRLLPMPLLGAWGETMALVVQLLFVAVLARHDRKVLGSVHPATIAIAVVLIASHALFELLAVLPPVVSFAQAVAGG
jgi:uncharacterized membrane protein YozB (DUF420 family)